MARLYWAGLAVAGALLVASGCDNGPSAVDSGAGEPAAGATAASAATTGSTSDAVARLDGRPLWSQTRRYSAEENARRNFERNGADFAAKDLDDFVRKAHAFVDAPPAGTLTLGRDNGDTLFYDPQGNVFAIATAEGAPRTMFKPREGMAYWEEQKAREARRAAEGEG